MNLQDKTVRRAGAVLLGLAGYVGCGSIACAADGEWPGFRGPWGNGWATQPGETRASVLPLRWSESRNVRWKTPIPDRGWSTPAIAGGRIWLTTATLGGHDFFVIGVDAESGRVLVNRRVFHADAPEPLGNPVNGYASPSPAVGPDGVYVHFGSYGTACLDPQTGASRWERTDLPCRHYRGPGSSPILFENLLILTMDGVDVQYVVALDAATGRTVWKTDRTAHWDDLDANGQPQREGDFRKAYATPYVAEVNGEPQMLSAGARAAYAYDPRTGRELWRIDHRAYSSAPCPVYAAGLAIIATGLGKTELLAVRPDGHGDVTSTHIAWRTREDVPRTPSPVVVSNLLYTISDDGSAVCRDAATGKTVWRQRLGGTFAASPIFGDGRLYFFDQRGKGTILAADRTGGVLATNRLDDGCMASPAATGSALIIRTKTHLYRIESADTTTAP